MKIVAILERSKGDTETGTAWIETAVFDEDQPIRHVINWAAAQTGNEVLDSTRKGRLMLDVTDMRI